jgi:hypothetical protein
LAVSVASTLLNKGSIYFERCFGKDGLLQAIHQKKLRWYTNNKIITAIRMYFQVGVAVHKYSKNTKLADWI